ncbi:MAG: ferredoxin [Candidatus Nanopelagicales bacterium]
MTYVIMGECIDVMDRSCVEVCPVDCIYEGDRKLYVNPVECIECGACDGACPVDAIVLDVNVPGKSHQHINDNALFFQIPLTTTGVPIGQSGGAKNIGRVGVDTPFIRSS